MLCLIDVHNISLFVISMMQTSFIVMNSVNHVLAFLDRQSKFCTAFNQNIRCPRNGSTAVVIHREKQFFNNFS